MRGPLPTVPSDYGYGQHTHEVYNDELMISTVPLPPFILTSVGQVPLYPDCLPKRLYIPVVASIYGNISCILHPDYPAAEPMFGCHYIQFGMRFGTPLQCMNSSLRGRVVSVLEILLCYYITSTLLQDHNVWLGMDNIIDMLLPGCLPYNLAGAAQSNCRLVELRQFE